MCKNAQMFNEPGSQIYRDARVIMKTVKQKKFELEAARVARENRGSRSRSRAPIKKRYATDVSLLLDFQQVLDRKILCNKETIKSRTSDLRLFGLTLTLTFEVLLKKVFWAYFRCSNCSKCSYEQILIILTFLTIFDLFGPFDNFDLFSIWPFWWILLFLTPIFRANRLKISILF